MPMEIKAYACEYCSRPALSRKYAMKKHEMVCWKKHSTRSCPTCKFQQEKRDGFYACAFGHREQKGLPLSNCKHWELKQ